MGGEWKQVTLGEALTLQRGFDLPKKKRIDGPFPIISSSGPSGFHRDFKVPPPGVVTGRYGTIGKIHYVDTAFWPLNTTLWVKDFKDNNPKFIYYLLHVIDYSQYSDKAAVPGINRNHVHTAPIQLPPHTTQQAIAHILGAFDDKIDLNRRMNQTLESMARTIFKSWFVDFDGCTEFQDSELGRIPKGWEVKPLTQTILILGGGTPKTKVDEYWGGDIPWYSVVDAPNETDVFVLDTQKHITEPGLNNSSTRILPELTTIISARGTVGKLALTAVPMAMNQSCYGITGLDNVPPYFNYFNLKRVIDELKQRSHGSVFDTITRNTFKTISIPVPPFELMNKFEATIQPIMNKIVINLKQLRSLSQARDMLLPQLISGEVPVQSNRIV